MSKQNRSILAKFRCSILQLRIKTGRFNNTKLKDRICQICTDNSIENETHFLCAAYSSERRKLYASVAQHEPQFSQLCVEDKFCLILSNYE